MNPNVTLPPVRGLSAVRRQIRRGFSIYGSMTTLAPKMFLVYRGWVWVSFLVTVLVMIIYVFFWRAVYAETPSLGGLSLDQTLNYVLLAQLIAPATVHTVMFFFSAAIRDGTIGIELLRPIDLELSLYVQQLGEMVTTLVVGIPLTLVAIFFFGVHLPSDPLVWLSFLLSMLLGMAVMFCFDYAFSCIAFYTTEAWGVTVLMDGMIRFFSGAIIPLTIMPDWLRGIATALPFSQAVFVPVGLLSGTLSVSDAPRYLTTQLIWLVAMFLLSRSVFSVAVRKVTVQGG